METPDPNWTVYAAPVNAVLQAAGQMGASQDRMLALAGIDRVSPTALFVLLVVAHHNSD